MANIAYRPLAIIGFGCDLPGESFGPDEYWKTIVEGRAGILSTETDRWSGENYLDADRRAPEKTYCGLGGLVKGFSVRPGLWCGQEQAESLNRTQQLILDSAVQALDMAGLKPRDSRLEDVSMVVGNMLADENFDNELLGEAARELITQSFSEPEARHHYTERLDERFPLQAGSDPDRVLPSGLVHPVASILGMHDRAFVVDGACASGLLVVDVAARFLHDGTSSFVLAVGAMANMSVTGNVSFAKIGGLSPTGSTPLDDGASGLVPGEGAGAVLLCPLEIALKNGMRVHGVVRGSATRTDGRGKAIYAPNTRGQVAAMSAALAGGDFVPDDIDHVETHATGTPAGDAEELVSILEVTRGRSRGPVSLGSVKSLLGHGFPAAGIANLIKVLLCFEHERFAPIHHISSPHHIIAEHPERLTLHLVGAPWVVADPDRPRRALVNAFGFGGVDSTICVEQFDADYHLGILHGASPIRHRTRRAVAISAVGQCRPARQEHSGILDDNVDFDWRRFKVPPVLIAHMDGAQRLALEATRRLLDDKPIPDPERWGIILGQPSGLETLARRTLKIRAREVADALGLDVLPEELRTRLDVLPATVEASLPGYMDNIVAGRIANVFDVQGPSMVLDSGNVSFAATVDLAVSYLESGDCDAMIIGSSFASRTQAHRSAGLSEGGIGAEVMVAHPMTWAREHPDEVLAIVEVRTETWLDGSQTDAVPTAQWVLEAVGRGGDLPQRARAHQSRRRLSYVVDVFSGIEVYDSARQTEAIEPDTKRAASMSPQDGLRRASGRTVVECLHEIVHGKNQDGVQDERFRVALGWQSPEQAEVIWRLLGLDGRMKEPVRHGVG